MSHIKIKRSKSPTRPPVPAELEEVCKEYSPRLSVKYCDEITRYGDEDDYTWGFKIYRTVYSPGSDADFDRALDVLLAFIRSECFEDVVREGDDDDSSSEDLSPEEIEYLDNLEPMSPNSLAKHGDEPDENYPWEFQKSKLSVDEASDQVEGEIIDDRSNQQLWQRLKNDIEQDSSLEGATPAQLQAFFKQWIYARNANRFGSPRYRFFIIMDNEVIQNLSRIPLPLPEDLDTDRQKYSVKVLDAEFNPRHARLQDPERWNPKSKKKLTKDEGWFWTAGDSLASLFFRYRTDEFDSVRSWDGKDRPRFSENGPFSMHSGM